MKLRVCWLFLFLMLVSSCRKAGENPADAFNEFLSALKKQECQRVFDHFSNASQAKIREEAAEAIKKSPSFAKDLIPEKFYCTSVYSLRYQSYNRGSAKLVKIEGSNAVLMASTREPSGFALPGFSPMFHTNAPVEVRMVKENGAWKIDLLTPTTEEAKVINARAVATANEAAWMAIARKRIREETYRRCTNFNLIARWRFQTAPENGKIKDETGTFSAELLGAHIIDLPQGKGLQFRADGEALRLPEALLNDRPCGAMVFWFRRDDTQRLDSVLAKTWPVHPPEIGNLRRRYGLVEAPAPIGRKESLAPVNVVPVYSETGIEVSAEGRIHFQGHMGTQFNVQVHALAGNQLIVPGKFYQLGFIWNESGMRVYIDGNLDARLDTPVHMRAGSIFTEMGRVINHPEKTGSRFTIRDLRIYEGVPNESESAEIMRSTP